MKRLLCLLISLMALSLGGCGSNPPITFTPSAPSGGPWVLTGSLIQANFSSLEGYPNLAIYLADASGPVTNAAVTYMGPGISNTNVPYVANIPLPVSYQGSTNTVTVGAYQLFSETYTAGSPYTITASFDGQTYSDSITTVGFDSYQEGASGVTCSWVGGVSSTIGSPYNFSQAFGRNSAGTTVFTDPNPLLPPFLTSPLTLSGLPYSAAATVFVECGTIKTPAFPGTFPASEISSGEELFSNY